MKALIDFTGQVFGRLQVLDRAPNGPNGKPRWHVICECGTETTVAGSSLRSGATRSCGCLRRAASRQRFLKHGHSVSRGGRGSRLYKSWDMMVQRCTNPKATNYPRYGGRGITVCERWLGPNGFANFHADMGERPEGRTLDRIDNEGGYSPDNCQWATLKQQANNKRNSRHLWLPSSSDLVSRKTLDKPGHEAGSFSEVQS